MHKVVCSKLKRPDATSFSLQMKKSDSLSYFNGNDKELVEVTSERTQRKKDTNLSNHGDGHATGADVHRLGQQLPQSVPDIVFSDSLISSALSEYNLPTPPPTPHKINCESDLPSSNTTQDKGLDGTDTGLNSEPTARYSCTSPITVVTELDNRPATITLHSPTKEPAVNIQKRNQSSLFFSLEFEENMNEEELERKRMYLAKVLDGALRKDKSSAVDTHMQPLALADPPKSKLKRQLSRNSADETESSRSIKRVNTRTGLSSSLYGDCVDGDPISSRDSNENIKVRQARTLCTYDSQYRGKDEINFADDFTEPVNLSAKSAREKPVSTHLPTIPQSPGYFNMTDLTLTSPFMSNTPRRNPSLEDKGSVFVFPDVGHSELPAGTSTSRRESPSKYVKERQDFPGYDSHDGPSVGDRTVSGHSVCDSVSDNDRDSHSRARLPIDIITNKGFAWPKQATLTEEPPFSPRIVTTRQPQFASKAQTQPLSERANDMLLSTTTTSTPREHSLGMARDHSFTSQKGFSNEEEYIHHIRSRYKNEILQLSPSSREIGEILNKRPAFRSISDVERSPSEKEIRETAIETAAKYERSWSDPSYSPRNKHLVNDRVQRGMSNLARDAYPPERNYLHFEDRDDYGCYQADRSTYHGERQRDPIPPEVKRRLFRLPGEEYNRPFDYHRNSGSEDKDPLSDSMDIPEEVQRFLHSRNFHPEDLQNLQEIFKRNSSRTQTGSYGKVYAGEGAYGGSRTEYARRSPEKTGPKDFLQAGISEYHRLRQLSEFSSSRARVSVHDQISERRPSSPIRYKDRSASPWGRRDTVRPREQGEIDVRVSCESITEKTKRVKEMLKELSHTDKSCNCGKVEEEIMQMANDAYSKIERTDDSREAFQRFEQELDETNTNVYQALKILCGIKCLCKYGRSIEEIFPGSVVFTLKCPSLDSLEDLMTMYKSGELCRVLNESFVTDALKEKFDAEEIILSVFISQEQYDICKEELGSLSAKGIRVTVKTHLQDKDEPTSKERESSLVQPPGLCKISSPEPLTPSKLSPLKPVALNIVHIRSKSAPTTGSKPSSPSWLTGSPLSPFGRERKFSDSSIEQSPSRKAFKEINTDKIAPPSPTKKTLFDSVFWSKDTTKSPRSSSPKRKSSGLKSPWQHENLHPDVVRSSSPNRKSIGQSIPRSGNKISDV